MRELFEDYKATGLTDKITFTEYLRIIGYSDPSVGREGMDDGLIGKAGLELGGPQMFAIPEVKVVGKLRVVVLLVDFADRQGVRPHEDYEALLFSRGTYPTGSMADFYEEASEGKVQIEGSIHGWLRLPRPYSFYTNNESGMGTDTSTSYPNNAQAMAEDAVRAALTANVPFPNTLDALNQGLVTALFIVHAGPGAEVMPKAVRGRHIWSHKWVMPNAIPVGPGLETSVYLTVPEDCRVGVCAHELGHLAFQWDDFYDANYDKDGQYWDGSGLWDLMAGGSYNGEGKRPTHPAALHKMQHGWLPVEELTPRPQPYQVVLPPYGTGAAKIVKVRSAKFNPHRYLILENRQTRGFNDALPGGGLLVWRVDEILENTTPAAGLFLLQADDQNSLGNANDQNQGDAGDPFPGATARVSLGDIGTTSTSFPGPVRSGIVLSNITQVPNGEVTLTVAVTP
jgi:M6 family metalloprotease-like protein